MNTIEHFRKQLEALHRALGIPADYEEHSGLPLCMEPEQLVATEPDYYQRPQQLTPEAFQAWSAMKQAAAAEETVIFLISAYRDCQYQHDLIARKLAAGQAIEEILAVNAAPGFSEHHTGRALDIGTENCDALVEEFENTVAFQWLTENSEKYGFHMSYPQGNSFGIDYEPWHWCYQDAKGLSGEV